MESEQRQECKCVPSRPTMNAQKTVWNVEWVSMDVKAEAISESEKGNGGEHGKWRLVRGHRLELREN